MQRKYLSNLFYLLPVFFLLACVQEPAQVVYRKSVVSAKADYSPKTDINLVTPYKVNVQSGQTLYAIARENHVPLRELIELNKLRPPYKLRVGQQINLPRPNYHVVQEGDTIYDISRGYEVDLSQLVRINALSKPYTITNGQKLRIPAKSQVNQESTDGTYYADIDRSIGDGSNSQHPPIAKPKIRQNNLQPVPVRRQANVPSPSLKSKRYASKPKLKRNARMPYKNVRFDWPLQGKVISQFGPKKGGLYNDGINIAAPENSAVKAAAEGKVVYSGNELKGYGNLLLIKHPNGYLTAYAHTKEILVSKGEYVSKGQRVASVGKSGNVNSPQLHFSVRKGRKAINPTKIL